MRTIDLNADIGEGASDDASIIPLLSSVNVSCGGHAGDPDTMRQAIEFAAMHQAAVGAHPGYEDRSNFGRLPLALDAGKLRLSVSSQLHRFRLACQELQVDVHHVKPHGALYNQANLDPDLAQRLSGIIAEIYPATLLYCPPSGWLRQAAINHGLLPVPEGFIDRRYACDGSLVPRSDPNAIIHSTDAACMQAVEMALHQQVTTIAGTTIPLAVKTLCLHGDTENVAQFARTVRKRLEEEGLEIAAR